MLFNQPDTPKTAPSRGASTPHVIHVTWTHPTQHPKLHLSGSAVFAQLTEYFTTYVKTRLMCD